MAEAVFASVAVTVMVGVPAAVKVCVALVALVTSVCTALPSPQSTVKLESVELAAGAAVMLSEYKTPVLALELPEMLTLGGGSKVTVISFVSLAVVPFVSVAVTVTVGVPTEAKLWVALVALFAKVCSGLPSPQLTLRLARLEPGADAALMPRVYKTVVSTLELPERLTVGFDRLIVSAWVALAVAVLESVAVTVMVGVPTAVKVCVALVALVDSVCTALPSPQSTVKLERLELGAAAAVMVKL